MIDDFKVSQALLKKLSAIKTANSWDYLIHKEGEIFNPTIGDLYIREFVMVTNQQRIGIAYTGSEIQKGIYQVDVLSPKGTGKWLNLQICGLIQFGFSQGSVLTQDDVSVRIEKYNRSTMRPEENWNVVSNSIYFTVIN